MRPPMMIAGAKVVRTGLAWAVVWAAAGAVLARVPGFFSDLPFAIQFAPLGFITGATFSGILLALEGRPGLESPSFLQAAGWGAVSGFLLTGAILLGAALRGASLWEEFLQFGPALTVASAVSALGSVALTRRRESLRRP